MRAIETCRTEALGGQVYACPSCGKSSYSYHSCRNRHCPKCQHERTENWLTLQRRLLLPAPYFMLTFTLPEELRPIARQNQRLVYHALFQASAEAAQTLARDPRRLGVQIGMIGVLHTWTRNLFFHPHVHYLVPGGGVTEGRWIASSAPVFSACCATRRSSLPFPPRSGRKNGSSIVYLLATDKPRLSTSPRISTASPSATAACWLSPIGAVWRNHRSRSSTALLIAGSSSVAPSPSNASSNVSCNMSCPRGSLRFATSVSLLPPAARCSRPSKACLLSSPMRKPKRRPPRPLLLPYVLLAASPCSSSAPCPQRRDHGRVPHDGALSPSPSRFRQRSIFVVSLSDSTRSLSSLPNTLFPALFSCLPFLVSV